MSIKMILDGADAENVMQITREYGELKERCAVLTEKLSELSDKPKVVKTYLLSQAEPFNPELVRPHLDDMMKAFEGSNLKNKIGLIKSVRAFTGWGLKESKDYVEKYFPYQPRAY